MTPQELLFSILHLAFQGKLVSQNPDEKVTDKTAFLPDDTPFDVPESWRWNVIGKCCDMFTGNSISESEKKAKYEGRKDGYDYIGTKDVSFDHIISYNNGVRIPFQTEFKVAYKDSILMCIEGGSAGRKIAILDRDVCFGNKLCMFKAYTVSNTYLYYYLQSTEFKKSFMDNMAGIIGGVSIKKLKDILLPIPPLDEQRRIVAKIEELLPLIDRYEEAWSKLEDFHKRFPLDMQKSILHTATQGKLVPQDPREGTGEELYKQIQAEKAKLIKEGKIKKEKPLADISEDEIPFEIPSNWIWCHIPDMCYFQEGPGILAKDFRTTGIPLIRIAGMQGNSVSLQGCNYLDPEMVEEKWKHFKLDVGDIVISTSASLDKIAEVDDEAKGAIPYTGLIRFKMFGSISKEYFTFFIKSPCYMNQISQQEAGSTIKHYGPTHLKKMVIPLPPLAEQKRIVAKLEEILPLCDKLK